MTTLAVQRLWYGHSALARFARGALWPAEALFLGAVELRNAMYDGRLLAARSTILPAVSVGNISVGGTGKTPFAAWIAAALRARGAHPAVVLRGYGGDEPRVHERLNPAIPVVVSADRIAGIARAQTLGADVVVLDDAFQHRRAERVADLVLVSAERRLDRARLLPAGPLREPVTALRRASVVVVTRKTAPLTQAVAVLQAACVISRGPGAIAHLAPGPLVSVGEGTTRSFGDVRDRRVVLITGIAEPEPLAEQLRAEGAVVDLHAFPDHHRFTDADLARVAALVSTDGMAVCTLKDAVKIAGRWPGPGGLWYVSQLLVLERGGEAIERVLDALLAARRVHSQTAG